MSVKSLAGLVSLTPPAVAERIKRLEKTGVIKGYRAIIDPARIGKKFKAIINLTLKNDKRKEIIAFTRENSHIIDCHLVTGTFSVTMKAIFQDMAELDLLVDDLQKFGNTHTLVVISSPVEDKPIL